MNKSKKEGKLSPDLEKYYAGKIKEHNDLVEEYRRLSEEYNRELKSIEHLPLNIRVESKDKKLKELHKYRMLRKKIIDMEEWADKLKTDTLFQRAIRGYYID